MTENNEVDTEEEARKAQAWLAGQKQRPVKFYPEIAKHHIEEESKENEG